VVGCRFGQAPSLRWRRATNRANRARGLPPNASGNRWLREDLKAGCRRAKKAPPAPGGGSGSRPIRLDVASAMGSQSGQAEDGTPWPSAGAVTTTSFPVWASWYLEGGLLPVPALTTGRSQFPCGLPTR